MNKKNDVILSIGLIVKNEEQNLTRCLDSLESLMKEVPCQLIITDTGSTDKTVEIAKKYTEEVYSFEWCDDFAAARNFGLEKAKGKWFMFMDADEWFDECSDIVEFFKTEEYKKYNSASYKIRNFIHKNDENDYLEQYIVRMFKRTKSMEFKGRIHEYLPKKEPNKLLSSFVKHTSYANDFDIEKSKERHERNIKLLLKDYNENPSDMRTAYLLAQQYKAGAMEDEFKLFVREKCKLLEENDSTNLYFSYFLYYSALSYKDRFQYKGIELLERNSKNRRKESAWDLDLTAVLASLYHVAGETDKALELCDKFLKLFDKFEKGKLVLGEAFLLCPPKFTDKNYCLSVRLLKIKGLILKQKIGEANEELCNLDFSDMPKEELVEAVKILCFCADSIDNFKLVAQKYKECKPLNRQVIIDVAEELAINSGDAMLNICVAFNEELDKEINKECCDEYLMLQNFRYSMFINKADQIDVLKQYLEEKHVLAQEICSEMIIWAMIFDLDIDEIIEKIDHDDIQLYTRKAFAIYNNLDVFILRNLEGSSDISSNIETRKLYLILCVSEIAILKTGSGLDNEQKEALFKKYIDIGDMYLKRIYKADILTDIGILNLDRSSRFIYFAKKALMAIENNHFKEGMSCYRVAVKNYPVMADIVKLMLDSMLSQDKHASNKNRINELEFNLYANRIKEKIKEINQQGFHDEAIKLLNEYKIINGKDEKGISELERVLEMDN
ncbi:glycosyltransferase family 2 protein [Aminipila sp.]|uniref:glycosyltransferase family 2 protein n=1 Tax=Aminipila sp. TaxID=2060095 RepID=UPI00289D20EA|nr:glycosyltransferase family 2 protein [Aminipila sp.]